MVKMACVADTEVAAVAANEGTADVSVAVTAV